MMELRVLSTPEDEVMRIALQGRLDLQGAGEIEADFAARTAASDKSAVIDLSEVPFLASIGMRIRQGVTSHGFALNVDPDMSAFDRFTVCGLHDVTMTSLRRVADARDLPMPSHAEVRDTVAVSLIAGSTAWSR